MRVSGEAGEMVAEGNRDWRVGVASGSGLTRRRGHEWKKGWVA